MTTDADTQKTARIITRLHPEDKADVERAARIERKRPSEWVRELLVSKARLVLTGTRAREAA
jgi:uncharacterized protein (DUF1778 family)